ncbi:MAG: glycosyltransferase [Chloroflexota bacterium]|nr:glycosyltransferase [Chloroflexota bacterium]
MTSVSVLHLIDSLAVGGAERVAVNLVNALPRDPYRLYLGTTRAEGLLASQIAAGVGRLRLARHGRFDAGALRQLLTMLRAERIQIIHAHSTSVVLAAVAALFVPRLRLIWHIHYGRLAQGNPPFIYRLLARRLNGVITVSMDLKNWVQRDLHLPSQSVWYIPNFVTPSPPAHMAVDLPGTPATRLICVGNVRYEKDPETLVRAMALVVPHFPTAHLLFVGRYTNSPCVAEVRRLLTAHQLTAHVTFLGEQTDVPAILHSAAVGVLSSRSEGLPMTLLEYGAAALPVVATTVGQCAEVLDGGAAGLLVPPQRPDLLAAALLTLLADPARRATLGRCLQARVQVRYSSAAVIGQVDQVYRTLLGHTAEEDAQ